MGYSKTHLRYSSRLINKYIYCESKIKILIYLQKSDENIHIQTKSVFLRSIHLWHIILVCQRSAVAVSTVNGL